MSINMSQTQVKDSGKRLKKLLHDMGFELTCMDCLELSARLLGFNSWDSYWNQHHMSLSPLDQDLTEEEFLARDQLQMGILEAEEIIPTDPAAAWHIILVKFVHLPVNQQIIPRSNMIWEGCSHRTSPGHFAGRNQLGF